MKPLSLGTLLLLTYAMFACALSAAEIAAGAPRITDATTLEPRRPSASQPLPTVWQGVQSLLQRIDAYSQEVLNSAQAVKLKQQAASQQVETKTPMQAALLVEEAWPTPYEAQFSSAKALREQGEYLHATQLYTAILDRRDIDERTAIRALRGLATTAHQAGDIDQAIALLETALRRFPRDTRRPERLFELGLLYREVGLHRTAIDTFYRILDAVVSAEQQDLQRYRKIARQAMFEIAQSYFALRDYQEALDYFERIHVIDLSPLDRATIIYYQIACLVKAGKRTRAIEMMAGFREAYPDSPLAREILFAQSDVLFTLQKTDEAVAQLSEALRELVRMQGKQDEKFVHWRQIAGNRLANWFMKNGDYASALNLYQQMFSMHEDLEWQMELIYQMGVCYEHLELPARARESYHYILAQSKQASVEELPETLVRDVAWRLASYNWIELSKQRLESLFH